MTTAEIPDTDEDLAADRALSRHPNRAKQRRSTAQSAWARFLPENVGDPMRISARFATVEDSRDPLRWTDEDENWESDEEEHEQRAIDADKQQEFDATWAAAGKPVPETVAQLADLMADERSGAPARMCHGRGNRRTPGAEGPTSTRCPHVTRTLDELTA